jgi:DnaJ-class molecular chaperone
MKKYFEFLGLQEGADKNQVQEAYERLSKEISTNSTKGIHEIQSEYNNIQEAYRELMKEFNKTDKNSIDYYTSKSIEKPIIKNKNRSFMRNFYQFY